jgi:hypothetical protein
MPIETEIRKWGTCFLCQQSSVETSEWKGLLRPWDQQIFLHKTKQKPQEVAKLKGVIDTLQGEYIDVFPGSLKYKGWKTKHSELLLVKMYGFSDTDLNFVAQFEDNDFCIAGDGGPWLIVLLEVYCPTCCAKRDWKDKFPFIGITEVQAKLLHDLSRVDSMIKYMGDTAKEVGAPLHERVNEIIVVLKETQEDLCRDAWLAIAQIMQETNHAALAPGGKEFLAAQQHFHAMTEDQSQNQ